MTVSNLAERFTSASTATAFLASFVLLSACSDPTDAPTRNFRRPVALAATCLLGEESIDCGDPAVFDTTLWILDADRNSLAVLDPESGRHLDTDPTVPGFNAMVLGNDLVDLQAGRGAEDVFVLSREDRELIRVNAASLEVTRQAIGCHSESFEIVDEGPLAEGAGVSVALVTCPEPAGLLVVPLGDDYGSLDAETLDRLDLSGRPVLLDVSSDGSTAYVVHRTAVHGMAPRLAYLSQVDLATGDETLAGLAPACRDGLDNDEDGFTDHEDPGCRGPDDVDEDPDPAQTCDDGLDNDGDGFLDLNDPDCGGPDIIFSEFHLVPWPGCMNLKDDDGDGLTDAPNDPDCYGPTYATEFSPAPRLAGRPAVSPDGAWVYVPVSSPPSVVAFAADPLERVAITPADGPAPNPLLDWLGLTDVWLSVPPVAVLMTRDVDVETGEPGITRAFVSLASGQVVRVVVADEEGAPVHDLDLSDDQLKSSTGLPILRVDGEVVDRTVDLHAEYPSLGPRTVNSVPGATDDVFNYYGIIFNGESGLELSETWKVTYEGAIPGAAGTYGFFLVSDAVFKDPVVELCSTGINVGDHLVLEPPPPACLTASEEGARNLCEYGLSGVDSSGMDLVELDDYGTLGLLASLPAPVSWVVRPASTWTVVGSNSGFLHNQVESAGECVESDTADSRFTGRAFTSLPKEGDVVEDCPPLEDDPDIEWRRFTNPAFSFNLYPPCETDEQLDSTVLGVPRDLELSFVVAGGRTPLVVGPGGILQAMTLVGTRLYVADATSGAIYELNTADMVIDRTLY